METKTQIGKSGRIIVPAKLRKELDIRPGDEIVMRLEEGQIRLIPLRQAVKQAQKIVREYVPQSASLVDDLIRERRHESQDE
jgi:AbrB family looped-hinge helix DNA binding protein